MFLVLVLLEVLVKIANSDIVCRFPEVDFSGGDLENNPVPGIIEEWECVKSCLDNPACIGITLVLTEVKF